MTGSCREAYRSAVLELGRADERVVCLDADTGMWADAPTALGERYVAVGIAEATMVGVAAGLALAGRRPFVTTMATFATTRAAEQIKVDVALPGLPVRIAGTHAGLSAGHLEATHHALEDLALVRALPGFTVVVPADPACAAAATLAVDALPGPAYLRLDRAGAPFPADAVAPGADLGFRLGRARVLRPGDDAAVLACGPLPVAAALQASAALAARGIGVRVLDVHSLAPLDVDAVVAAASATGRLVTVEEHAAAGGLGDAVGEVVAEHAPCRVRRLAVRPPVPALVGSPGELVAAAGLDTPHVIAALLDLLEPTNRS